MKRLIIPVMAVCALVLTVSMASAATEAPADDMQIVAPEGIKAKKPPVTFPHSTHKAAKIECDTCHHTWDGEGEIEACATAGCHDQPGKKDETAYYNAFHARKADNSCLGCHKARKKAGNKVVPVSCKQCHVK